MLDPLLHVPSLVSADPYREAHLRESVNILLHELLLILQVLFAPSTRTS